MLPQAMSAVMPRLTRFADGITAVDTEYVRPQMDAAHIVVVGLHARPSSIPAPTPPFR